MLTFFLACVTLPGSEPTEAVELLPPAIETVWFSCSAPEDTREVQVRTEGWTGGGLLAWTLNGESMEEHPLGSIESDPNGEWDELLVQLSIVADPAAVARGARTAMLCDDTHAEHLAYRLSILAPDTNEEADCRFWGPETDWESLGAYPPCDTPLDSSEVGDTDSTD